MVENGRVKEEAKEHDDDRDRRVANLNLSALDYDCESDLDEEDMDLPEIPCEECPMFHSDCCCLPVDALATI